MSDLKKLRQKIDAIDINIIEQLAERKKIVLEINDCKKKLGKNVIDSTREKELMDLYTNIAKKCKIDEEFTKEIFQRIHLYCRELQQ